MLCSAKMILLLSVVLGHSAKMILLSSMFSGSEAHHTIGVYTKCKKCTKDAWIPFDGCATQIYIYVVVEVNCTEIL